ncbi:HlyD family secretion protein [Erwinia psidii]|uniref:HlyD family secretion protein n=1 Tax=Erwinia psidii TaxID=69224 RepID=A0A3N6UVQ1_9GAMM|nr:HlyD family secretion protein [Erwinia psidii]MCX8956690.1 HlyD family secretion protein [Erwinia psidii]MCX8960498.1 HlyD family secretion protein [Erwinia psidii]MCX8964319.1 HlyD family secretion protein [Erwinia psidii]RQM40019.1 HlyD family secretion protein [Erwinia psidii]
MRFTPAKRILTLALLLLLLLAAILFVWSAMKRDRTRTEDAVVTADYTSVAPKVSGYIHFVNVSDNQHVKAGQLVATLDDQDYRVALESAEASLKISEAKLTSVQAQFEQQQATIAQNDAAVTASKATLEYAEQNAGRYRRLLVSGTATADEQQKTNAAMREAAAGLQQSEAAALAARKAVTVLQAGIKQAQADITASQASVDQARLNLSYTHITAPTDGFVGQRSARRGAWVSAGTRLMSIVPLQQSYVVANFLETQLGDVHTGQSVSIKVDALPEVTLRGHVDSIAPATGSTFAAITADNATGNYTKIVQRVPVKILLEPDQPDLTRLRVGMSVVPEIESPE